jgi:hypothetical protein
MFDGYMFPRVYPLSKTNNLQGAFFDHVRFTPPMLLRIRGSIYVIPSPSTSSSPEAAEFWIFSRHWVPFRVNGVRGVGTSNHVCRKLR